MKIEFVCPECGHRIVTDDNDMQSFCEKCGCRTDDELCEVSED